MEPKFWCGIEALRTSDPSIPCSFAVERTRTVATVVSVKPAIVSEDIAPARQARNLAAGQSVGPFLRSMKNAQDTNCCFGNDLCSDIWRSVDHQFACPSNSSNATACWKIDQTARGGQDPFADHDSGRRIVCLDRRRDPTVRTQTM